MFHVEHRRRTAVHVQEAKKPGEEPTTAVLAILGAAAGAGAALDEAQAVVLAAHLAAVYEENTRTNLTRIPVETAAVLHVADSLAGIGEMSLGPAGPWADIGSGAGYPGIALGVAGRRHVDLIESVGKKADFLSRVARDLCLDVTVLGCRAEEAAVAHGEEYSAVSARAVSELPSLVELAAPLLKYDGVLVCWKGEPAESELERGRSVAKRTGMREEGVRRVELPGADVARTLVVYRKCGASRVSLPRRTGLAQSRPLA
jgi:16S rRNA (guanine527-N7)-methyltransferase